MQAVVLAGGLGTRLRPVTYEIPKPLVPVKKKPILNHLMEFLTSTGVDEIILIINTADTKDYERWLKTWDDQPWINKIKLAPEKERLGTFGALHSVKHLLKEGTFLMSNGDSLMQFDIQKLLKTHKESGATITTTLLKTQDPLEYGLAILDGSYIVRFTKDPKEEASEYISAGFYAVSTEILSMLKEGEQSLEKEIMPELALNKKYAGAIMEESRFYECGTLPRWEQAIKEW